MIPTLTDYVKCFRLIIIELISRMHTGIFKPDNLLMMIIGAGHLSAPLCYLASAVDWQQMLLCFDSVTMDFMTEK